jgi:hypothetical protein
MTVYNFKEYIGVVELKRVKGIITYLLSSSRLRTSKVSHSLISIFIAVLIPEICLVNAIDPSDVKNYPDGTLALDDDSMSTAVRSYPCLTLECRAVGCDACRA